MVRNPRQVQKILGWGIDCALNLLYDFYISRKENISHGELTRYFVDQMDGQQVSSRKISKTVYELKRHNYINDDEGDSVRLTDKAKIKLIDKIVDGRDKDGKLRLISFDIPEVKRASRDAFRKAIKKMGFVQIQKSLWVSDWNVGDMVDIAAKEFKVSEYVGYFVIESSNIEKFIETKLKSRSPKS